MVIICTAQWSLYVPPGVTHTNSTFCPNSVFMCFVWISEQTAIISLYSINWLVFITETDSVYCAVRTGYLNVIQVNVSLQTANLAVVVALQMRAYGRKCDHQNLIASSSRCRWTSSTLVSLSRHYLGEYSGYTLGLWCVVTPLPVLPVPAE